MPLVWLCFLAGLVVLLAGVLIGIVLVCGRVGRVEAMSRSAMDRAARAERMARGLRDQA